MSRLPAFAQGARFFLDTTPDQPQEPDHRSYVRENAGGYSRPFSARNFSAGSGSFRGPPQNFDPRGFRNFQPRQRFAGNPRGRQWTPRRPNFSNPYEKQLTPRDYAPRQQRWQHTFRGGRTPLSTEFGPCASGASPETLAIIDAFVKPSMLEDPWRSLEEADELHSMPKKEKLDPDVDNRLSRPTTSHEKREENQEQDSDDDEQEFNIKDFIPKA